MLKKCPCIYAKLLSALHLQHVTRECRILESIKPRSCKHLCKYFPTSLRRVQAIWMRLFRYLRVWNCVSRRRQKQDLNWTCWVQTLVKRHLKKKPLRMYKCREVIKVTEKRDESRWVFSAERGGAGSPAFTILYIKLLGFLKELLVSLSAVTFCSSSLPFRNKSE